MTTSCRVSRALLCCALLAAVCCGEDATRSSGSNAGSGGSGGGGASGGGAATETGGSAGASGAAGSAVDAGGASATSGAAGGAVATGGGTADGGSEEATGGGGIAGSGGSSGGGGDVGSGGDAGSSGTGGSSGGSCSQGSGSTPAKQTLVFVRHAQTMANICEDACSDSTCCQADLCSAGCANDCNCDENITNFSPTGWTQITDVLVNKLKALGLRWDKVLVSPTWRTQVTIQAYMEAESLCGEIVPEIDECWNEDSGSCTTPPWETDSYTIVPNTDGVARLVPRAYRSEWDPDPATNPQPQYNHSDAYLVCENIVMDRGYQYIEEQFSNGAMAVLAVTHSMTGAGLLKRLTESEDYWLENASAYTVLSRTGTSGTWTVEVNNAY